MSKLMGILNVTPDSFSDGGLYFSHEKAIERGFELIRQGADLIDVGGESTRPFSKVVETDEELRRVIPVIKKLSAHAPISIDTVKPQVADAACLAGAALINDIQGFRNVVMIDVAKKYDVQVCIMHMQGTPDNMQTDPAYPKGVVEELTLYFKERIATLLQHGIKEEKIILDPGIGFGKTVDDNVKILHNLKEFKGLGYPLLVGLSRKSFMTKILNKPASGLLAATIAMSTLIWRECDFLRVHDVEEHKDILNLLKYGWQ